MTKTMVSALHKELEYKVEKLKYKAIGDHAAKDQKKNPVSEETIPLDRSTRSFTVVID